jgi:vacuolar protein sorting-associated protein 13D
MLVSPNCPSLQEEEEGGQLKIVNIQFNSLDVIANQETIIELIGFHRRVFPPQHQPDRFQQQASLADLQQDTNSGPTSSQFEVILHSITVGFWFRFQKLSDPLK